jgi:hypothetical protein
MVGNIQTFPAKKPFASNIGFIRLNFDDPVIFHFDFQPTVLGAEDTTGFMYRPHECSFLRINKDYC